MSDGLTLGAFPQSHASYRLSAQGRAGVGSRSVFRIENDTYLRTNRRALDVRRRPIAPLREVTLHHPLCASLYERTEGEQV